mmetsp:Transcript_43486/g.78125  ORF Transcript_43486/g.78125 Transcript_43486/m.78125 type:complete len:241 (+) Transcript_43486:340-1062(+)
MGSDEDAGKGGAETVGIVGAGPWLWPAPQTGHPLLDHVYRLDGKLRGLPEPPQVDEDGAHVEVAVGGVPAELHGLCKVGEGRLEVLTPLLQEAEQLQDGWKDLRGLWEGGLCLVRQVGGQLQALDRFLVGVHEREMGEVKGTLFDVLHGHFVVLPRHLSQEAGHGLPVAHTLGLGYGLTQGLHTHLLLHLMGGAARHREILADLATMRGTGPLGLGTGTQAGRPPVPIVAPLHAALDRHS